MGDEEKMLTKYFDDMCDIFNTKKIMFGEWEVFYGKLKNTILSDSVVLDYDKYVKSLKNCIVYCEDYVDERKYKDDIAKLKTFLKYLEK